MINFEEKIRQEVMESIDLSVFKGAPLESIRIMFGHCTSLTSVDLSPLNTEKVTNFGFLFRVAVR